MEKENKNSQHEDAALKVMMQFFAEELLPYLGIPGKVIRVAPTETIQLELHKSYEDFNLVMEDGSADHVIRDLRGKMDAGETLAKEDLVSLTLVPLMGEEMEQKDRILESFDIIREARKDFADQGCIDKLEAVIYTMAEKFLENLDMEDVRKGVAMTRLGQMLIEEGLEKGREEGREESLHNIMETLKLSLEQAMDALKIPDSERAKYQA